jgi:predicted transcriptional regulator
MSPTAKKILEKVASWPEEDQEELAEVAREIEARRTGIYVLNDAEQVAVDEGLRQLSRGQFAPEDEMQTFWKRFGVV